MNQLTRLACIHTRAIYTSAPPSPTVSTPLWGSNTNCLCFALRSFLIRLPSTFQNFTFTLPPSSSTLLQTPECSEYHPSEQSHVVSALSLTRIQLSGTNSLFLSTVLPLSALLNLPWKPFSFKYLFFSLIALICDWCVCVRTHVCVCACVHSRCMHWILTNMYL